MTIKKKIIVIDDEEPNRKLLKSILEKNNYVVYDVPNGEDADIVLQSVDNINLIITDLMMPGEHGLDIMNRIRNNYKIPVLVISGIYDKDTLEEEGIVFHDGFLKKPIDRDELLILVAQLTRG